ncbi:MAG: tRNA (adenosine(37)-N6)-dimethylallyltransferase MiaA [Patescibacteria group bacterium]
MVTQRKNNKLKFLVILGPTASGKTSLSIKLAKKFNGEIISADSRQVYKGLDIGTGKVTKKEMRGIKHHLLDVASPKSIFDVVKYKFLADKAVENIIKGKKLPILCGGTGLYIDAVAKNIVYSNIPKDLDLRKKLEEKSTNELFLELKKIDKKRAKTIDKNNKRRLIRAIEIVTVTGKSIEKIQSKPKYDLLFLGIKKEQNELHKNIFERVKKRMRQGMIEESKKLHKKRLSYNRMMTLGLEYKYLALFLQKKITKDELINKINIKTRQYAKRQMTWFKRNEDIHWISSQKEAEIILKDFLNK